MDAQKMDKFLTDAVAWATNDKGWDVKGETFVHDLFMVVAPMSNFEIGTEDIEKFLAKDGN